MNANDYRICGTVFNRRSHVTVAPYLDVAPRDVI